MRTMIQPGSTEQHDVVCRSREQQLEEQHRDAVQNLAYGLWVQRGEPAGSSEVDWLNAENKLMQRLIPSARS